MRRFARIPVWSIIATMPLLSGCGQTPAGQDGGNTAPGTQASSAAAQAQQRDALLHPQVVIQTSLGSMTVRLDAEHAPITVDNFLNYVRDKHYDQTIFHHVEAGYAAMGGGFSADLTERRGQFPIRNEARNGRNNLRGTLAMSRQADAIDSSTCQFFINLADNPGLDHSGPDAESYGYCVFGEVVQGQDVLDRLSELEVRTQESFDKLPTKTVLIETIRLLR